MLKQTTKLLVTHISDTLVLLLAWTYTIWSKWELKHAWHRNCSYINLTTPHLYKPLVLMALTYYFIIMWHSF